MIGALVASLRPRQWTKNLLLFAGVVFSRQLGDGSLALRAAGGFLAFSLLSGCVYLLNDIRDVEEDRRHPTRRSRPIASGALPVPAAIASFVPLLAIVVALSRWLGTGFMVVAGIYLVMNLAYTFFLKRQVLIDVFVIAAGFVLRAIGGVELLLPVSPGTELSPWLLMCTFFGALFIALGKRGRELSNAGADAHTKRAVLEHYTPEVVEGLLLVTAATSVMSYSLYTIWPDTVAKFGTDRLLWTVPLVAYGIFRYFYLVRGVKGSEDPSLVLITDRPLATCVLLYLVAVLLILYRA